MIKQFIAAAALCVFAASGAHAQDKKAVEKKSGAAQQQKMAACNKDAGSKGLKGNERKKFMSSCLKG